MCLYVCSDIHIADQGKEFVNEVQGGLCKMTNLTHCITSVCHSQANGLVACLNSTVQTTNLNCIGDEQLL